MRELKFRAWSKTNKKMYDRVLAGPGDPCSIIWDAQREEWVHFDAICGEIMQFTGLKDKNGRDVYEGDIVQGYINDYGLPLKETIEQVAYDEFMVLQPFHNVWDYDCNTWVDCLVGGFEVIGNIYEHPELVSRSE